MLRRRTISTRLLALFTMILASNAFAADELSQSEHVEASSPTKVLDILNPPQGDRATATAAATDQNADIVVTPIHAVQGDGESSPLKNTTVTIRGIVVGDFQTGDADTGRDLGGFFLQEEDTDSDGDPATSEGIFVFDGFVADVNLGDQVEVAGTVDEYFGETQIDTVTSVTVLSSNNRLPEPAVIDLPAAATTVSQNGFAQPDLEAFEGMRVVFPDTLAINEMFQLDRFNEIKLVEGRRPEQYTQSNLPDADGYADHLIAIGARQIIYDDGLNQQNAPIGNLDGFGPTYSTATAIRMGDQISGLAGVLDYKWAGNSASGSTWRVRSSVDGENVFTKVNRRPETPRAVGGSTRVAGFNVLNYFTTLDLSGATTAIGQDPRGADSQEEFERQTQKLTEAIVRIDADVLGLIELENDFMPGSPGNAIEFLVDQLNTRLGSDTYAYVDPGRQFVGSDAISVGIIYKPDSVDLLGSAVLDFVESSAATTFDIADILNAVASSDDQVSDFSRNRPSVAASFRGNNGEVFTVAVNHFKSKGDSNLEDVVGDARNYLKSNSDPNIEQATNDLLADPNYDQGDGQGFWNQVRVDAAHELAAWLASDPTGVGDADALILGDLNSYASEDPIKALKAAGYRNLVAARTGAGAYSYVFDGQVGTLDYVLASPSLVDQVIGVTEWHINADEADAIDYNLDFGRDPAIFDGSTAARNSDHDPVITGLRLGRASPSPRCRGPVAHYRCRRHHR